LNVPSIEQRLSALFDRVAKDRATEQETVKELHDLRFEVKGSSYRREKLNDAIRWAEIYFSPRKWEKWGSREKVRDNLLDELYKARTWKPV
jgi:hypothetical protein